MIRQSAIRLSVQFLIAFGATLLAIAAGQPIYNRPTEGSILVMVDLSPSTRGATFRDRRALLDHVHQLLGDLPYHLMGFSDRNLPLPDRLSGMPCDQTIYAPPPADAVLLFSDGRFKLPPYAPPTFPVIDPALDDAHDASVTELRPIDQKVLATIHGNSSSRSLHWSGAAPQKGDVALFQNSQKRATSPLSGDFTEMALPSGDDDISAWLSPGDLWPENDSLSLMPVSPASYEQWWVDSSSPANWRSFLPANLPVDSADYLRPAVIVLDNIPADALSTSQRQHLLQYVRDLGGSLVIVGGDHAFAAGNYDGTVLEDLSPLASSPPQPTMQWILLVDSSGSMAGDGSSPSPWQMEVSAITQLLPQLPAHDSLSIGSFAESLKWWSTGKSVVDTRNLQLPPPNIGPNGPTNLAAALTQIAFASDGSIPGHLLLMTDADTDLPNTAELAAALSARKIHLHLLAIGHGRALSALQTIASQTGGSVIEQLDAKQWVASATLLLRPALPNRYQHRQIQVAPPPHSVSEWNQTWMKSSATELGKSSEFTMAARWQMGLGTVTAIAYPAEANREQNFAAQIATVPTDPRFKVTWNAGSSLVVEVDAIDHNRYLNGESIRLEMLDLRFGDARATIFALPQIAPGEYRLTIPAPRESQLITVRDGDKILKRFAIAGRYAPEFDAIGNDRDNLQSLADRTGGSVINPGPVQPIHFHWPTRQTPLTSEFAFAGFALISLGLIWNRRA